MAEHFKVQGADALLELGKRLKAAGGPEVVKELQKGLRAAAKPVIPATRAEALRRLPKAGGLNQRVAKAPQRVTARIGNTTASVRVTVAGKRSGAYGANVGLIRHPVFATELPWRGRWATTRVPSGWFDEPAQAEGLKARDDVVQAMTDFAERLTRPL